MGMVRSHLWFVERGHKAAQFSVDVAPRSRITSVTTAPPGVPDVPEGTPFVVEVDHDGEVLAADGGRHGQCGWLTDRFGVSWQVVPRVLDDLMRRPDLAGVARATAAMFTMTKLEIAPLEAAYAGR